MKKHRHDREHNDERGIDDRAADLERGIENDGAAERVPPASAMLADAAHDVLDVDDGIVDHRA